MNDAIRGNPIPAHAFITLSVALAVFTGCTSARLRSSASKLRWEKLRTIPDEQGFAGSFAGVTGGALVVAGGANIAGDKWGTNYQKQWTDSVFVLERLDGKWRTGFKLPHSLGYGASVTVSNGIICIGGSDAKQHYADVFRFSWKDAGLTVSEWPKLPIPCANLCGAKLGNRIYVAGGIETPVSTTALKTFWMFDLAAKNPHWVELEPWPGPERMLAVAGIQDGAFYLVSGVKLKADSSGKPVREYLRDAYSYTPKRGWRRLADLPYAVAAAPSLTTQDHGLLIFSGDDGTKVDVQPSPKHSGFSREVLAYDANKNAWQIVDQLPFSRVTTSAVEWRGHVVIPMGEVRPRERTPEVWWAELPSVIDEKRGQK